jgi:hypothetical protein
MEPSRNTREWRFTSTDFSLVLVEVSGQTHPSDAINQAEATSDTHFAGLDALGTK